MSKHSSQSAALILLQKKFTFFSSIYLLAESLGVIYHFKAHPSILTRGGSDFLAASLFVSLHTLLRLTLFYPGA